MRTLPEVPNCYLFKISSALAFAQSYTTARRKRTVKLWCLSTEMGAVPDLHVDLDLAVQLKVHLQNGICTPRKSRRARDAELVQQRAEIAPVALAERQKEVFARAG